MSIFPHLKFLSYIFFFLFTLTSCQKVNSSNQSSNQRLAPLLQDQLIQVYFNHSQASEYQETYRQQTRLGDDLEKQILDLISQAQFTIDIAVQELRLPKIAQALAEKQKSGVKVRLILENNYSRPWSSLTDVEVKKLEGREKARYKEFRKFVDINQDNEITLEEINQRDALVIIKNSKIPWIDDTADGSAGSGLMHHKFIIVDNRFVIITSANFTFSDTSGDISNSSSLGNANNLLKIDSQDLANLFTEEFNILWGDGPGGNPDSKFGVNKPIRKPQTITLVNNLITVNFSPVSPTQPWNNSSNGLISQTLDKSSKNIDMALFVFSDQRIANILENRHNQNVKIRALLDSQFAYRSYSEALDMMGLAVIENCKYEVDNRPWQNPITSVGIPTLATGDSLHHKFGIIDNTTVITGSHNWSEAGNHNNDETLLIIESPTVSAHFQREFNRLYSTIETGLPSTIQAKNDAEIKQCLQIKTQSSIPDFTNQKINLNTAIQAES